MANYTPGPWRIGERSTRQSGGTLMYQPDKNHDAAVQIALAMNERLGRTLDACDRQFDRGYYRMQRARWERSRLAQNHAESRMGRGTDGTQKHHWRSHFRARIGKNRA
jgi:hypothetical protein